MNSKELVHRAIHFENPTRLPYTGSMCETDFSGDTVALFPDFGAKWWLGGGGRDEWGCEWGVEPGSRNMGQVKNSILKNLSDYANVGVPDSGNPRRYVHWDALLKHAEQQGKYVVICNGPYIFERAHFVHGFEETLIDCMLQPGLMTKFLRHLADYHFGTIAHIKQHYSGRIHGYRGTDDWGTQLAPLLSPEVFRQVFLPVYQDIFAAIRDAGMDVWLHSCGQILPLLDDFIEVGLNVVNMMQPNALPIAAMRDFSGRVCFEVCADAQTTLLNGTPDELRKEVGLLIENCCDKNGGLIEVKLDRMYFEGDGVSREYGRICHEEYRKRDPFMKVVG